MHTPRRTKVLSPWAVGLTAVALSSAPAFSAQSGATALGPLHHNTRVASTVPGNGDVNPYGVAVVRRTTGRLRRGDVLISNFNDKANAQGTGTTIVSVSPSGHRSLFARLPRTMPGRCPGGVGLTTALDVTRSGWVVVGSLPTKGGTAATAEAGCLIVLGSDGRVRETFSGHGIAGPWDMAMTQRHRTVQLFVTNVLHGTVAAHGAVVHRGTLLRVTLRMRGARPPRWGGDTVIGSGFGEHSDPAALVVGPTGVAVGPRGVVYVADTVANRIARIPRGTTRMHTAGRGHTVTHGGALNAPLGLTMAADGHLVTANAGDGNLVEITPTGHQVAVRTVDRSGSPKGAGALFGLAFSGPGSLYFVDDATNTLQRLS
jgi:hypothetical protein